VKGTAGKIIDFPSLSILSDSMAINHFAHIHEKDNISGIRCEIVFWDTGKFYTPEYQIHILNQDSSVQYSLSANPIQIEILSSITSGDQLNIRPIKGPVSVRALFPLRLLILFGLLLILLGFMFWIWKKRVGEVKHVPQKIILKKDPFERANERLEQCESQADIKLFYVELSYLMRELMEYVFYIRTLEMTTTEIENHAKLFSLKKELFEEWILLLKKADLVKYAKLLPEQTDCKNDLKWVKGFIDDIKVLSEI
jgi:hypothetical protein